MENYLLYKLGFHSAPIPSDAYFGSAKSLWLRLRRRRDHAAPSLSGAQSGWRRVPSAALEPAPKARVQAASSISCAHCCGAAVQPIRPSGADYFQSRVPAAASTGAAESRQQRRDETRRRRDTATASPSFADFSSVESRQGRRDPAAASPRSSAESRWQQVPVGRRWQQDPAAAVPTTASPGSSRSRWRRDPA